MSGSAFVDWTERVRTSMRKKTRKTSGRAGPSTAAPVQPDPRIPEESRITLVEYGEQSFVRRENVHLEDCLVSGDHAAVRWIDVVGLQDVQSITRLAQHFNIHPLILEDIFNNDQRPKIEDLGDYIFILFKHLVYDEEGGTISIEQLSLVLGPDFVLSFQETASNAFAGVIDRIEAENSRIRKRGPDFLAYLLMDAVVDHYFTVLERLGDRIEILEEGLTESPSQMLLRRIHRLRRDMTLVRRSVWPLREAVVALERRTSDLIRETTVLYLRDVYDHTVQVIDTIETFRDTLTGMLDLYLSSVSYRLNGVMKVLTIIATIFMPLTFIAGVYGMNFKYMPELEWEYGYPAVLILMLLVALAMLIYFRKKKWI